MNSPQHPHLPADEDPGPHSYHHFLGEAVRELLIEKGVVTADEIRAGIERMDARGPHLGAQVVARAWVDVDYRERLLADGTAAIAELGIAIEPTRLIAVENTEQVHNMIVCTLCSCYPRNLLGLPPDWYKSANYRSRAVNEPRAVLAEFGTRIPDTVQIRVHDSTADMRYIVLPRRPSGTEGWSELELAKLVTRDAMIGVATVTDPSSKREN